MKTQPDALKSTDMESFPTGVQQTPEQPKKDPLQDTLRERRQARDKSHSMEQRHVTALENIADELAALRVHLTGK